MRVSQSLIKAYMNYMDGNECGLQVKARYFDGIEFPEGHEQRKGKYLEYLCTGEPDRNGKIPEPDYLKKGEKKGGVTAEFWKIQQQAKNFQRAADKYKLDITEKNHVLKYGEYEGIVDIMGTIGKQQTNVIIDIKLSGLLYDKWKDYGWDYESLPHKPKLLMQAVHYPWMTLKIYKEQMPFQYWVFSSTNEIDFEIFEIKLEPDRMDRHEKWLVEMRDQLDFENQTGWTARPDVARCAECPLKESCKYFIDVPAVKIVYLPY